MGYATQEELLRKHEKDLLRLKNRPQSRQQPGVPMTASAVAGVGAAVGAPGVVLFTAASSPIDIDGIFTPDFEDYMLYLDIFSSTAGFQFTGQLRNAGGLYNGAVSYRSGVQSLAYAGASSYSSAVQNDRWAMMGGSSGLGGSSAEMRMFSPARGGTEVKMLGDMASSGGRSTFWGWCNSAVGVATGLRLAGSAGTFTGALRVYGINPN